MLAMRQKSFVFSLVGLFFLVSLERAIASPSLDQQYGFKNFVIAVLASPAEPIHSKQVENELISQIQKRMRFSYQAAPSAELKKNLEAISGPIVAGNLTERLEIYRPTLQALKEKKTDAAILARAFSRSSET